eukprot:1977989-Pyramimonas_sp.AAC.1
MATSTLGLDLCNRTETISQRSAMMREGRGKKRRGRRKRRKRRRKRRMKSRNCLLYTSDAADDTPC